MIQIRVFSSLFIVIKLLLTFFRRDERVSHTPWLKFQHTVRTSLEVAETMLSMAYLVPFEVQSGEIISSAKHVYITIFWSCSHTHPNIAAPFSSAISYMFVPSDVNKWHSWEHGTTINGIIFDKSSNKIISIKEFMLCDHTIPALHQFCVHHQITA